MTDVIFSFDTEDFTSNEAADAIYEEAKILREEGVKGGFALVGLLAKQLENWGRYDILEELKYHDIGNHTYGHSLHPTVNEYTDIEDFEEAKRRVLEQEEKSVEYIKHATKRCNVTFSVPPGNQKSYAAMYAYSQMGQKIYSDTYCDTVDGLGCYYCNMYNTKYTFMLEGRLLDCNEDELPEILDELSKMKRVIMYNHPNIIIMKTFWDRLNYFKENKNEFGKWEFSERRDAKEIERYYSNLRAFIKLLKNDGRFRITSYSELEKELDTEGERKITLDDIPFISKKLEEKFYPLNNPVSYSLSDIFLACVDFLKGESEHICKKVYGFLSEPGKINESVKVTSSGLKKAAKEMDVSGFLPTEITVDGIELGPADFLRAALKSLCGKEEITVVPGEKMPCLDLLPDLRDCADHIKGWVMSDDFKDNYISDRLKLQAWTLRFLPDKA